MLRHLLCCRLYSVGRKNCTLFCNNFVSLNSIFIIFWQAELNLEQNGNRIAHLSYAVKYSMCQSVYNCGNLSFKSHDKLSATEPHVIPCVQSAGYKLCVMDFTMFSLYPIFPNVPFQHWNFFHLHKS